GEFFLCSALQSYQQLTVQSVAEKLSDCITHFIQLTQPFDYSTVTAPFVLSIFSWSNISDSNKSNYDFQTDSSNSVLLQSRFVFKAQHLQCIAHMVFTGTRDFRVEDTKGGPPGTDPIYTWMEYVIEACATTSKMVLVLDPNVSPSAFFFTIVNLVKTKVNYIPTFALYPNDDDGTQFSGFYNCWYPTQCYLNFTCSPKECFETMETTFQNYAHSGKNSAWVFHDSQTAKTFFTSFGSKFRVNQLKTTIYSGKGTKSRSPFEHAENQSWGLPETIYDYIVGDQVLNLSDRVTANMDPNIFMQAGEGGDGRQTVGEKHCRVSCQADVISFSYQSNHDEVGYVDEDMRKHEHGLEFECVSHRDLEMVIEQNLTTSKTMLVVFSYEFLYYWNIVKQKTAKMRKKFGHNFKTKNDKYLGQPVSILVTNLLPEKYNFAAKRVHSMLTSGLFWFWEKWDKIRFPKCLENKTNKFEIVNSILPLSMDSSVVLTIVALFLSNSVSALIFISEVLIQRILTTTQRSSPALNSFNRFHLIENFNPKIIFSTSEVNQFFSYSFKAHDVTVVYSLLNETLIIATITGSRFEDNKSIVNWVNAIYRDEAGFLRMVLILREYSVHSTFLNELVLNIRYFSTYVPIFVIFPSKTKNIDSYISGYYVCWYESNCQVKFECLASDCVNTFDSTFNQVTNFGRKSFWELIIWSTNKRYVCKDGSKGPFKNQIVSRQNGARSRNPFTRVKPRGLLETTFDFLTADLDCNISIPSLTVGRFFDLSMGKIEFAQGGPDLSSRLNQSSSLNRFLETYVDNGGTLNTTRSLVTLLSI
ncbi:unnamed protein product, partial [Allacma fusca]